MIVVDPGHGMGNRTAGVFDPGIIGVDGAREADWTLLYAYRLRDALQERGLGCVLTRQTNEDECSLASRVAKAAAVRAAVLVSLHFNGDAIPGVSAPDGHIKGFEALYGTPGSKRLAELITSAVSYRIPTRAVSARGNLYVLRYEPSVLLEVGFLDDPEDFRLVSNRAFMAKWCEDVAFVIKEAL